MTHTFKAASESDVAGAPRWKFAPLGGGATTDGFGSVRAGGGDEHLSGKQMAHRALEAAYQRGLTEGFGAASTHAGNESDEMTKRIDAFMESVQSQYTNMDSEVADALLNLAFSLARQVIRSEVELRPELVASTVRDALSSLAMKATYPTLHLNPGDIQLIRPALDEELKLRGCSVIPDPAIKRGGCRMESDNSHVDATIESRWERALLNMGYDKSEYTDVPATR